MNKMYNDLHSKGLEIVLVTRPYGYFEKENIEKRDMSPEVEFERLKGYREKWDLDFPMVVGGQENFEAFGVGGIPHYVVIGRDGKVASYTIGFNEPLHKQLRDSVEKELAKSAATEK